MPLRKVLLFASTTPANNMASFTNVTARRLHVRKTKLQMLIIATVVAGDRAAIELAERSSAQGITNDSRSLIDIVEQIVGDATGAGLAPYAASSSVMSFNRGDLVLDTDEAIFLNGIDGAGTPTVNARCNIFYED